ncbi:MULTISPECIES: MerR family transcriptional regulator [Actinotignum]|uniref:MerR family transcriptional regulator n=1 Tax=Actinotignum TaxID=1653174 RepID=UPI0026030CE8|nr:helix-turn-helix domain-containing protein [uncultured Actinomyces sp.]
MSKQILTTREVASLMGVSRTTVTRWCSENDIRAVRLPSGQWRIPRSEVDRILAPVAENASPTATSEVCAEVPGQLEIFG